MNIIGARGVHPWSSDSGDTVEPYHEPHTLAASQGVVTARKLPDCGTAREPLCDLFAECKRRQLLNNYWRGEVQPFALPECEAALREIATAQPERRRGMHKQGAENRANVLAKLRELQPCSVQDIASELGLYPETVRGHLQAFCRAKPPIVHIVYWRKVNRTPQAVYALVEQQP